MKYDKENKKISKGRSFLALLSFLEVILILAVLSTLATSVIAGVGQNVTVITRLDVGNVYPEIINVTIENNAATLDLIANSTRNVTVTAVVRDFNGESDLNSTNAEFFDNIASSYGAGDDNNNHYTNSSCLINFTYGTTYEALVSCTFAVQYYANNATWNSTFFINDTNGLFTRASDTIVINKLLAVGLPDVIDYGVVNATNVSSERVANVTNFGNVALNLSVEGYARNRSDGYAMNCSLGAVQNISIGYEKYNLTASNTSILSLSQFQNQYINLTNQTVVKTFNLNYRQNDITNEAINATYWRIYVPVGVAGACTGNIIFGATQAAGT